MRSCFPARTARKTANSQPMFSAIEAKAEQLLFKLNAEENIQKVLAAAPPTRFQRGSGFSAPQQAPRTTRSRDSSTRTQQRSNASSKPKFSKSYVSPFVTKAQQLAVERAVSARKRIREERLRAKAEAEARENHARGRTPQPQPQPHIRARSATTVAGRATFNPDPAVSIEVNETKQTKGTSYRLPVSNTVPPKPMTIRKNNVSVLRSGCFTVRPLVNKYAVFSMWLWLQQVPIRRPLSPGSATTSAAQPQAEQNFVVTDGNADIHELPSPHSNVRGNWPRLVQHHTAGSDQRVRNSHDATDPAPTTSLEQQQRAPPTPPPQQPQPQQGKPAAAAVTHSSQDVLAATPRGAGQRLRTPPPSNTQAASNPKEQEVIVAGQLDDNVVRRVSRATQTGEKVRVWSHTSDSFVAKASHTARCEQDGIAITARPHRFVVSDLPSVKFNKQYKRNRATSPFDLNVVERLLAGGREGNDDDGSISTQRGSSPSSGAEGRKQQQPQERPPAVAAPHSHKPAATPREPHFPHAAPSNGLNANAVPSGTAEVYQQVLSAQVASQQVSVLLTRDVRITSCGPRRDAMIGAFGRHKRGCSLRLPR